MTGGARAGATTGSQKRGTCRGRARRASTRRSTVPRAWARNLARRRPGLVAFVLNGLADRYGRPVWRRRLDPTSELILTILSQNSADLNAERAFESLRACFPGPGPTVGEAVSDGPPPGWGGRGIEPGPAPDWAAIEVAPLPLLIEAIRPGGLAAQKGPRIQAALRAMRESRGDYELEFLADMPARTARDWLTTISGVGPKTASVVLMFSFGAPLMPVDRHVERVSKRIGLLPAGTSAEQAHDLYLEILEPDQVYEAHVNLIRHGREICEARRPRHDLCPLVTRCRFVDRRAP